jgi:8-oxo-dGTP diphosphatase
MQIPNNFYRISIKGLVFDDTGNKFMLVREDNDMWELPGGGLDFGEGVEECLKREFLEEMGLDLENISSTPSYFFTWFENEVYRANVLYECSIIDFTTFEPSQECQEYKFFDKAEASKLNLYPNVIKFLEDL